MTLEEFEKRLRMQVQYQGSQAQKQDNEQNLRIINQRGDTSPIKRQISIVNKTQETPKEDFNNKLASKNKNVKATMSAPISSTIERTTGISAENANPKKTIFDDLGNVSKNLWIGAKQGGLNFVNSVAKVGNVVSEKVFNREERTKQALDEDLKKFGVDGTGLTIEEKAKKLIEIDPLSLDKYNELLTAGSITYNGDGIGSKIGNAISVLNDDANLYTAPYEDLINGITLTENEEGNQVSDSWFGNRDVKNIDTKIQDLNEEANKNTENVSNSVLKYIAGLSPSIGNNASSLISETLLPGAGTLYFTGSAINSYALDGKERGLSDDASLLYGATLGIVDGQLEKAGLSTLTKAGKDMLKGSTKQALKNYAISIADNYIQEALMEPAQETANQVFTGESDWNNMLGRMHEAGVAGAVSSTILGGASAGMSKGMNIVSNLGNNQQSTLKTEIIEKINKNNLLEDSVKNTLLNSLNNLNNKSLTTLNQELNTIDEVITQIQKADVSEVIGNRKNLDKNTVIKQNYAKYKNATLDKSIVNTAMELVETNKQNKRTKEQWLKVAEQIGNNITSQEAEMYAYKTWMDMKPNNKENLNRQGKSYVPFTLDEWVNKVKEASNKVQDANIQKNASSVMQDANAQVLLDNTKDLNQRKELLVKDIYENVPERTSKNNQKNNARIREYLEETYPKYHIEFTNFKSDGTVVIQSIQTNEEYIQAEKEFHEAKLKEEENKALDKEKNKYKTTPINAEDKYSLEYNKLPSTQEEFDTLNDIRSKLKNNVEELNQKLRNKGYHIFYDESKSSADASYLTIEKIGNDDSVATIRIANHFKNGVSSLGDYNIDLSEYTSKQAVLKDVNDYINNIITETSEKTISPISNGIQNNISPLAEEAQLKKDIKNFSNQVNSVINGTFPKRNMLILLSNTPRVLQDIGLSNYPITMTQRHLKTIMNETGEIAGANYHDLGENIVKQLPEAIANPLDVVESNTREDSIVLTTHLADKQNRTIVASIKIDGIGRINDIEINSNIMTSAYGRNNYDEFMKNNIENGKLLYDTDQGIIKKVTRSRLQLPRTSNFEVEKASTSINNIIPSSENYVNNVENRKISPTAKTNKVMNPAEIANLTEKDASSTPIAPTRNYGKGNKESRFYRNVTSNSKFLNKELRQELKSEDDVRFYQGVTNEESLTNALKKLNDGGQNETLSWFNKDSFDAEDVAEGWILMKRYQDAGDYRGVVEVIKKMRNQGTTAGQTIQAFNIMNRLTPEGMVNYAQGELSEAFEKMSKNKTKEWIDANREKFELTPEETAFIMNNIQEAQTLESDSRERAIKLGEIQKVMKDKLPPDKGAGIKAWMRISMLFNPKTQVRNVAGNAIIAPVNAVSDIVSAGVDKVLSKKTGVRTTGVPNLKSMLKGAGKGLYNSYDDFKRDINTRNMTGNRYEFNEGDKKSFNTNTSVGKSLYQVERLLSFMLDAGDRVFYEASFVNSINNQKVLNNSNEVTQDMIDIATNEALSRTWQDNNEYTKFVLSLRRGMNKFNIGGYGLGDVLIPFAKTPANLTKAIIDYSPVGVVSAINSGRNLKNSLSNGQYTAQMQHDFVQKLGKATAGTMLYVLGYALAKAGITTGESDEDKDVANFMKNTLGTSNYSIKIGDKTFQYDWAQPVAAPIAMMANLVGNEKDEEKSLQARITETLDVPFNMLLEQSFLSSIQNVFSNNQGVVQGIEEQILDLPSRAVPTLFKQVADLIDPTQRQTYVKGDMLATATNKVIAKIPGASKMLAPTVDTLGREVKKYGGDNGIFNVFFNPANVNSSSVSRSAREIYNLYKSTGDKTIFPRVAGYSLTYDGNTYNLSPEERATYQKTMGTYANQTISKMLNNKSYESLTDIEKTEIINRIVSDANEYAKEEYAKNNDIEYERKDMNVKVDEQISKGLEIPNAYIYKTIINSIEGEKGVEYSELNKKLKYVMNMETSDTQKQLIIDLASNDTDYNVNVKDLNKLNEDYSVYLKQSGKKPENGGLSPREKYIQLVNANIPVEQLNKYYSEISSIEGRKDSNGKNVSGSKKQAVFDYVNSLKLTIPQKQILLAKQYTSFATEYHDSIVTYLNSLNISGSERKSIYNSIYN